MPSCTILSHFLLGPIWICIHYKGLGEKEEGKPSGQFDRWNYMPTREFATAKAGTVVSASGFPLVAEQFTRYFKPLALRNKNQRIPRPSPPDTPLRRILDNVCNQSS